MPMTAKAMMSLLEKNGFVHVRSNGSHYIYVNRQTNRRTTVPYHTKDLAPGTEHRILSDAGLLK